MIYIYSRERRDVRTGGRVRSIVHNFNHRGAAWPQVRRWVDRVPTLRPLGYVIANVTRKARLWKYPRCRSRERMKESENKLLRLQLNVMQAFIFFHFSISRRPFFTACFLWFFVLSARHEWMGEKVRWNMSTYVQLLWWVCCSAHFTRVPLYPFFPCLFWSVNILYKTRTNDEGLHAFIQQRTMCVL